MPPRTSKADGDFGPFLDSVTALFAEQSNMKMRSSQDFKHLRTQLITFLELCTKNGITKAKASHDFTFSNGTKPRTELRRPPTWMKIEGNDKRVLGKTRKANSLVKDLSEILKRQSREKKKALDTSFSDSDPEPEPKKRKRYGAMGDDEYEPPQPKKSKTEKPTLGVQPQPTASRRIKARRTSSGWSTCPSQKDAGDKRLGTLDFKVTKNADKRKEVAKPPSRPSFSNSNQHGLRKEEEQRQSSEDFEYQDREPTINRDTVVAERISAGTVDHLRDSTLDRSVTKIEDTDMDTDDEDECGTHQSMRLSTPTTVEVSSSPGFWPSAPKTTKSTSTYVLHEHFLPLGRKEKEVETPLERLRASLEIYETQIAHIPCGVWKGYNRRLERFCSKADFSDLPFSDRFSKFRQIIYRKEEDAAAQTDDWERLRKAAKLCGFLAEVTAPPGEDARMLIEREVSVNLRDINWLQSLYSSKDHLWT